MNSGTVCEIFIDFKKICDSKLTGTKLNATVTSLAFRRNCVTHHQMLAAILARTLYTTVQLCLTLRYVLVVVMCVHMV
jgi:hypothetical protein